MLAGPASLDGDAALQQEKDAKGESDPNPAGEQDEILSRCRRIASQRYPGLGRLLSLCRGCTSTGADVELAAPFALFGAKASGLPEVCAFSFEVPALRLYSVAAVPAPAPAAAPTATAATQPCSRKRAPKERAMRTARRREVRMRLVFSRWSETIGPNPSEGQTALSGSFLTRSFRFPDLLHYCPEGISAESVRSGVGRKATFGRRQSDRCRCAECGHWL